MAECLMCGDDFPDDQIDKHAQWVCDGMCDEKYVGVCPACRVHAAIGRAVVEEKHKLRRAFGQGHVCDATAMCQGIVDLIEARAAGMVKP